MNNNIKINGLDGFPKEISTKYKEFIGDIEFARKRRNWSQEELANRAMLSPKTYKNMIAFRSTPRIDAILKILWTLGMADRFFEVANPQEDKSYTIMQKQEILNKKEIIPKDKLNF